MHRKKGMTLGEVLITMTVMAFIAMIAIMTVKPFEKAMRTLYARALEAVRNSVYNAVVDSTSDTFFQTPRELCEGITEYINTIQINCNIAEANLASNTTTNFADITPHFIASNAMRFYISAQMEHTETDSFGIEATVKYYYVFVDLTGERPPNSSVWTQEKPCDIVAFIVTDASDVFPIGPPEVDTRYLTARVSYPATIENPENVESNPMSYWDAKHASWGNHVDHNEAMSLDFSSELPATSPYRINYPASIAVHTDQGCSEETSPCNVVFQEYY